MLKHNRPRSETDSKLEINGEYATNNTLYHTVLRWYRARIVVREGRPKAILSDD